ncbi:HWE histidine kinase domain-containing protein [Alsobacter sp. KACC 23698]|uniref:Blue-light-activated histidine kinase n=1 Tax=Alsobacter sp. KACC 23698 TaxID=3149229 RepID=A0AAU7JB00_9HYPH
MAIFAVAVLVAAAVAAMLAVLNTDRIATLSMRAADIRENAYQLESTFAAIISAETSAIMLGDDAQALRIRDLAPQAKAALATLEARADPAQKDRLERIGALLERRLAEADRLVRLAQAGEREQASAELRQASGRAEEAELRSNVLAFIDGNRSDIARLEQGYRSAARRQLFLSGLATLAILLFAVHQIVSAYRALGDAARNREGLRQANERLEEDVSVRTRELAGTVQRFEVALRAADVVVFTQDVNRIFTWISRDVFGYARDKIIGSREEDFLPAEVAAIVIPAKTSVLETGKARDYQYSVDVSGGRRWFRVRTEPVVDEAGQLTGLIGAIIDLTGERQVQQQLAQVSDELRTTVQRFQVALKGADITVFAQGPDLRYSWMSRDFHGRIAADFVGRTDADVFPADLSRKLTEMKQGVLDLGEPAAGEFRVAVGGVETWQLVRVEPQRDARGGIVGILGASVDVTDRRQRETHNRILLRELTHRTKNLLAVVQAMARQTLTTSVSARDFEARFSGRLQGLASSLDILVNENWQGASVSELVRTQLSHWRDLIGSRIRLTGEDVRFEPEAAQNIGLALHELSTNSAKYGALSTPGGSIEIAWSAGPDADGRFVFTWRERNGPRVEPPRHKGFGHAVIERLVPRALNGRAQLAYDPEGFSWTIDIPASHIRPLGAEPSAPKVWAG